MIGPFGPTVFRDTTHYTKYFYSQYKVENKCQISNIACSSITCSNTGEISGTIRPDLLGIDDADFDTFIKNSPKLNDGTCALTFDEDTKMFVFDTRISECGVQVGEIIENGVRFLYLRLTY